MSNNQSYNFTQTYPGPFKYVRETSGTENTFDIKCTTTGKSLAATYFWYDKIEAQLIAQSVCYALNRQHPPVSKSPVDQSFHRLFGKMYEGPFAHRVSEDDFEYAYEIYCTNTGDTVIHVSGRGNIAEHFADALNQEYYYINF